MELTQLNKTLNITISCSNPHTFEMDDNLIVKHCGRANVKRLYVDQTVMLRTHKPSRKYTYYVITSKTVHLPRYNLDKILKVKVPVVRSTVKSRVSDLCQPSAIHRILQQNPEF